MTPDINVLVAASRTDHPHHPSAMAWLQSALADSAVTERLLVLPMVAAGFLRVVTHPRVFPDPTPLAAALGFLRAIVKMPGVVMPRLGEEWPALEHLCESRQLTGNSIPDAWIAAAVATAEDHLVTFDRDFVALLDHEQLTILQP